MLSNIAVLARLAVANIFSSALNVFVGLVLFFGAALLVVGGALFSTLDGALSHSIVDSITGHVQVYGARSKDALEIYGKVDGSDSNLSPIDDFKGLKAKLLAMPNVERVVPMGAATALVGSGNTVDVTLEKLRAVYRAQQDPKTARPADEFARRAKSLQQHVRNMVNVLAKDVEREGQLTDGTSIEPAQREALAKAATDEFWARFEEDPLEKLELLENRVAPLVADGDLLFLRCLGTDLDGYQAAFSRMSIVEGTAVPSGHRGVLIPKYFREEYLKLKNARRLDKIRDALDAGRRLADASDKDLQRFVRENQAQTREIVLQLDGEGTAIAVQKLQALLHSQEPELAVLLGSFFGVSDENFQARYQFFYAELAPLLQLYRARVGDELELRSFGRSGATQTVLVKVYGVFELRGMEKSPLAGVNALIDMVSFRDLYGFLSAEKQAELDAMKAQAHVAQVSREDAEAALFGEAAQAEPVEAKQTAIDDSVGKGPRALRSETFDPAEVDEGVVLHAAVLLKDGSEPAQLEALHDIQQLVAGSRRPVDAAKVSAARATLESGKLPFALSRALQAVLALEESRAAGATAPSNDEVLALATALKAERAALSPADRASIQALVETARPTVWTVGWGSAAGFLGNFIAFFRLLLLAIVSAFSFIALIVVTLGMTIATLQRTQMIGTMRAIGAQRGFVVQMVMIETVVLALTFGVAGALAGIGVVKYLHWRGIPAFRDELYFFFSGPVLRPELTGIGLVLAIGVTLVVSVLAVLFPTYLATRVPPVRAMQPTE